MDFYDLYLPAEDPEEVVRSAENTEFTGLAIAHKYVDKEGLDGYLEEMDRLDSKVEPDLIRCCVVDAESPEELKKTVGKIRQKVEVVAVDGGDFDINKAAVGDSRVDILLHPEYKRKDSGMDHKTTKMASENDVVVGFVFHNLHQTYGKVRSHVLNHIKKCLKLCEKYDAEFIVTSGAGNKYEMRGPRELSSLLSVLGVEASLAIDSVSSTPKKIVKRNRRKLGGKTKRGGVEELE